MKITMPALLLSLVSLHACVDSEELAEQQQAEIIEVHGCRPGFLEVGEGDNWTCILDPWWGRGAGGGGEGGESGGGGGGGGGAGGPGRKPDRKVCGPELGEQGCLDCCYYNHVHVDGWECNRKKTPEAKRRCWEKSIEDLSKCQVDTCDRHGKPIITITVQP